MNSHLTPEQRVNKNGVLVTKLVNKDKKAAGAPTGRSGLLSRLLPVAKPQQSASEATRTSVRQALAEAFDESIAASVRAHSARAADFPEYASRVKREEQRGTDLLKTFRKETLRSLEGYSDDTIRMISEAASQDRFADSPQFSVLYTQNKDELALRESLTYLDTVGTHCSPATLRDVRHSLGSEDLSLYPDRRAATAVLRVAMGVKLARYESGIRNIPGIELYANPVASAPKDMTTALAEVITRHPDRTDDIIIYISLRNDHRVDGLDTEGLEEMLRGPARSLSEGAL